MPNANCPMPLKIAYGVHGYGRGHSSRALAVLPQLASRHEVLILAGGDAYEALASDYSVCRIPVLRYALGAGGKRSPLRTIAKAVPNVLDLHIHGPARAMVGEVLEEFAPDVVVSDSEIWTHHSARRMKIPRISFDHYGVLAYCRWPMSPADRITCRMESSIYRSLMAGRSERTVVVSFYAPPPKRPGVCVVGPVLREIVQQQTPARGDYLLVYFSNGRFHFTERVESALRELGVPTVVYGVGRQGADGNLDFRPPANEKFVADLAGSRAVFSTAGNQLISEALHLRKPLLLLPEDSLEQRLSAVAIERMGVGLATTRRKVSVERLAELWRREGEFAARMPADHTDGRAKAVEAIETFAHELTGK